MSILYPDCAWRGAPCVRTCCETDHDELMLNGRLWGGGCRRRRTDGRTGAFRTTGTQPLLDYTAEVQHLDGPAVRRYMYMRRGCARPCKSYACAPPVAKDDDDDDDRGGDVDGPCGGECKIRTGDSPMLRPASSSTSVVPSVNKIYTITHLRRYAIVCNVITTNRIVLMQWNLWIADTLDRHFGFWISEGGGGRRFEIHNG